MNLVKDLRRHRARHFSQNGEDGVIARLLEIVGVSNRFYVELGAGAGEECNTRWLRENGWLGVMLDRDYANPELSLYQEFVTAENVNELLAKYHVPAEFDVLSIDIDGNDYWVWKALLAGFRPRVAVVEFNAAFPVNLAVTMSYDPLHRWCGEPYIGQSLMASQKLGAQFGYSLVYAAPPNAFLVLRSLLPKEYVEISAAQAMSPAMALLMKALPFIVRQQNRKWEEFRSHRLVNV